MYTVPMKKFYGIWIDHEKAFIFKADETKVLAMESLTSEVEPHHHSGINSDEHSTLSNQFQHNERRTNEMHRFTKLIMEKIHDADEILIFGPGTAKNALHTVLQDNKSMSHARVTLTVADKLTENQMRECVEDFFVLPKK